MNATAAALVIEVVAGLIPGVPMMEHTRRWSLTREEWNDQETWARTVGAANMYMLAMLDPARVNWVRLDWIWL